MAALLKNLFAGIGNRSASTGPPFSSGSLIGRPTPIPSVPAYNTLGTKRPKNPTPIPGVPSYRPGLSMPPQGRNTLLS